MSLIQFCRCVEGMQALGMETIAANYPFLVNRAAAGGAGLTKHTLRFGVPDVGTGEGSGDL